MRQRDCTIWPRSLHEFILHYIPIGIDMFAFNVSTRHEDMMKLSDILIFISNVSKNDYSLIS